MMRRAAKTDANHAEIARAFRRCGWWVVDCSRMGQGFPDLMIARAGRIELVEVKDGCKSPSRRKLTPDQVGFHAAALMHGVQIRVIESVDQVIALGGNA